MRFVPKLKKPFFPRCSDRSVAPWQPSREEAWRVRAQTAPRGRNMIFRIDYRRTISLCHQNTRCALPGVAKGQHAGRPSLKRLRISASAAVCHRSSRHRRGCGRHSDAPAPCGSGAGGIVQRIHQSGRQADAAAPRRPTGASTIRHGPTWPDMGNGTGSKHRWKRVGEELNGAGTGPVASGKHGPWRQGTRYRLISQLLTLPLYFTGRDVLRPGAGGLGGGGVRRG